MNEPDEYLIGHVREAIARRVGELAVDVRVAAGKLFLSGVVPSEEARAEIGRVAAAEVPDHEVRNETTVRSAIETEDVESLE